MTYTVHVNKLLRRNLGLGATCTRSLALRVTLLRTALQSSTELHWLVIFYCVVISLATESPMDIFVLW